MKKYCLLLFFAFISLSAERLPMDQLKQFADALNIEGGIIHQKYLRNDQIWANLCPILDRPFVNGVEWQELKDSNHFPLKEASIPEYNEAQANYAYALCMHYYITHAHEIAEKPADQTVKILIQVHRNSSGKRHVELLEQLLCRCYPELEKTKSVQQNSPYELFSYFFPELNVDVAYCYGVDPDNLGQLGRYNDVDIILSISLAAGLHPEWESSTLLIPIEHIPFSLKTAHLQLENRYSTTNHLSQIFDHLIDEQDDSVLQAVNEHFYSFNPEKRHLKAQFLTRADFKSAVLLQVDGLFNPSQLSPTFTLNTSPISLQNAAQ